MQKALYNIVDPTIGFQIHCSVYKTNSSWITKKGEGRESIPRYWITIGKTTIWDFPNMFLDNKSANRFYIRDGEDDIPFTIKET